MNTITEERIIRNGVESVKFYYSYFDPIDNRKKKRVCKKCTTLEQAKNYVSNLKFLEFDEFKIKNICRDMFVKGKEHLNRIEAFGKKLSDKTIIQKRQIIELISKEFGNFLINKITLVEIENRLLNDKKHSSSWKNFYIETFNNIFDETYWKCSKPVPRLPLKRFTRKSKKADIFTTEELQSFFTLTNWKKYQDYLIFLTICSCGLRLGEARAIKVNQIDTKTQILKVNGFCKKNGERTIYNKAGSIENEKIRFVPIPKITFDQLIFFIQKNNLKSDDYLFNKNSLPLSPDYLRGVFLRQLKVAKIQKNDRKLCPHSFRYTYVTRLRRNLNADQIQKLVGHSSVEMTEYYTRYLFPDLIGSLEEMLDAINKLFL